ncbi:MAG TPA: glutamine amidotransferase [Thermoguttaceae bacterium]|nr:glutamine amidotransferase [Thermoguttaceae bacterium]
MRWSLYPIADSYLLVGAAALVLLGLLLVGPAREKVAGPKRRVLAGLRLAVVVLVILAMLRPTLVYTRTEHEAATLVVLADRSRSMTVPDEVGGKTRWEALRRTLAGAQDALAALAEDLEVAAFTFDAEAHPADVVRGEVRLGQEPDGDETAIGAVLEDVLRGQAGKRLLGIFLLSDGAQRARPARDVLPQTAASRLKALGYPLFAVRFGKSRGLGQAQDVAVKDLVANQRVFVKNELTVTGQVRADGFTGREISVQLLVETSPGKMEPVDQKNLKVMADGELIPVQFTYVPQLPGEYKIALEAVRQPGELVMTNNRLSTFVNVLKGGLNVLYVEGFPPRFEQKFLSRALDASEDVQVETLHVDPRRPGDTRPSDLRERLTPGKYEVYVLGDLDSSAFEPGELDALADTVSKGAGLIMLGGFHSFGPGGYAETPLASVLPIRMNRFERQGLDDEVSEDLHVPGPLKMMPSRIGRLHFTLMLAGDAPGSLAVWERLPPLDGANRFRTDAMKPLALVLAEAGREQPLLVANDYGRGRAMAFAGDTTWHWWMRGHEAAHKRFWRQVVLWLARKDESMEGNVWIKLPGRRFRPGGRVEFSVGAQSPAGGPVDDADYQAEVVLPDGSERALTLVRGQEQMTGSFQAGEVSGDYTIQVTAAKDGEPLGSTRSRFLVIEQDLELDNAAADATMLESLAAMTGGRSLVPEELPDLIERLAQDAEGLEVRTETKRPLWDTWAFFLLLVGLLAAEWYLRKRWGLV